MSRSTDEYFQHLIEGINPGDLQEWEDQILDAEARRMEDKSAMDIIGANKPEGRDNHPGAGDDCTLGPVAEWIQLAISIQETQYGSNSSSAVGI